MSSHPLWAKAAIGRTRIRLFLAISIGALVPAWLHATPVAPDWWTTRSVLITGATANDYAAVNIGQIKSIANKAATEFNTKLPGGAGADINNLIATWLAAPGSGVTRDDYIAANQGQVKAVAAHFCARLIALGVATQYPWTGGTADNYAAANIGQVKYLFSFNLTVLPDTNINGIPDAWEYNYLGQLVANPLFDSDSDGLTNLTEYLAHANPNQAAQVVTSSTALDLQVFTP